MTKRDWKRVVSELKLVKELTVWRSWDYVVCGVLLLVGTLAVWGCFYLHFPSSYLSLTCKAYDLNETAIVLGAVAAFAGLMIPLHYSLVLDIIEKMKGPNQGPKKEIDSLKSYCHTSDIVVFTTAIFGVSCLFEGAFAFGAYFQVFSLAEDWTVLSGWIFMLIVLISVLISLITMRMEWDLERKGILVVKYVSFSSCCLIIGAIWAQMLIEYRTPNHAAFIALIVLALFYFLWLILRVAYTPMSSVARISLKSWQEQIPKEH